MERASAEWEKGRPLAEWLASHGRQIDNVRAALDWAFSPEGDTEIGVRLTVASIPLWFQMPLIDECFGRVQQALTSVGPGPSRDAQARHAMQLLGALGLSRALATGFAPDAVAAFARALEIAERLGDTENQLGMLYGVWTCRFATGEYRGALELGRRFAALAATTLEPADRLIGDRLIGIALHFLGEHADARRHLERMLDGYVAPTNRPPTIRFQSDQRVLARATLARILWIQGYPEQATREAQRTIEEARASGHAISLYGALVQAEFPIAFLVGDLTAAARCVALLLEHASKQPLGPWSVLARGFHGMLLLAQDDLDEGLRVLRSALAEFAQSPYLRIDLNLLAALAEGCGRAGALPEALAAIDAALERSARQEERWCTPELLRIRACLLLAQGDGDAESLFLQSLDEARRQQALSWELRTATSLALAWREHERAQEARELLTSAYTRFREGFASADLVAAKRLLEVLQPVVSR
jgi:tetratricopeptide (TPR) repeat protein